MQGGEQANSAGEDGAASSGGFKQRLQGAASTGGFERRRLRSAVGFARTARGGMGEEASLGRLKRYVAKCQLCVEHYVQYAPRIFDT
jgi:hypothetical protein